MIALTILTEYELTRPQNTENCAFHHNGLLQSCAAPDNIRCHERYNQGGFANCSPSSHMNEEPCFRLVNRKIVEQTKDGSRHRWSTDNGYDKNYCACEMCRKERNV